MDFILDLEAGREVALFQAAARNDAKTATFLIQQGAIVNCQDADNHCTALHVGKTYQHYCPSKPSVVPMTLICVIFCVCVCACLMTPACSYGNLGAAEALIRQGADITLRNKDGLKATDLALQNGYRELVFLLNLVESELT